MGVTLPKLKLKSLRLPRLIPQQTIPDELIQAIAHKIWLERKDKEENRTADDDWSKAQDFLQKHWWIVIRWKLRNSIKTAISFKTLSQAVNASVLIGAITFIAGEQARRDAQVYQAWQVITAAHGQGGSGGRIQALEFLNSTPRRIPWFWLHWKRESLDGLEAPMAYLVPSQTDNDNDKKGGIQLSKADLSNANLQEANLWKANLQKVNLWNTNLQEANLWNANLQGAHLEYANLQKANLIGADLQRAWLSRADLQGAQLDSANLQGTFLGVANLQGAELITAYLQGAWLPSANLQKANLEDAYLQGAHLENANLQKANLENTKLQGTDLENVNLQGANLNNASLQKALYTDKSTSQQTCILFTKKYPCPTIFPEGFDPKAAGMELVK